MNNEQVAVPTIALTIGEYITPMYVNIFSI